MLTGVVGPDDAMLSSPAASDLQLAHLAAEAAARPPEDGALLAGLRALLAAALAELGERPATVPVADPRSSGKLETTVGPWDLAFFARPRLAQTWGLRGLQAFFGPIGKHDFLPLATAAFAYRRGPVGSLMPWAMICASGASPERQQAVAREAEDALLGAAVNFPFPDACRALEVRPLGAGFRAPLRSDVPALFISGSLDGQTPARRAAEIARGFAHGSSLLVPGASHGWDLFYLRPEVGAAMLEFLGARPRR